MSIAMEPDSGACPGNGEAGPTKHILIAPACFKGSLSAPEVASFIGDFLRDHLPQSVMLTVCPIADGGDDTLTVLQATDPGYLADAVEVTGPLPDSRAMAQYLYHPARNLAVIEAAQAHGLKLLPPDTLLPLAATSYGVGTLIRHVMEMAQPETLIVTVGGSASTDGGVGALQALGVHCLDYEGQPISAPVGGGDLERIARIIRPPRYTDAGRILILTDVVNPLLGAEGCAAVFGPQKGADAGQIARLEAGLVHASALLQDAFHADWRALPGAGAAGGLAYGLRHLPRSGIVSGTQWIAEQLDLKGKVARADIVITGEGRLDDTSFAGKATGNLLAWSVDKPVLAFCGEVAESVCNMAGVSIFPLADAAVTRTEAMGNPKALLAQRLKEALPLLEALLAAPEAARASSRGDNCTD